MIMCKTYTKEDFDEDCPRFIPMKYESEIYENGESVSWYIFDTEKLDFIGDIVPYYDYQEAEKVCNIFNGVSYILKGDNMIEKLYSDIPSYGKSYFTEKVDEVYCNMVKKSLNVAIDVVDEYIKFWSDKGVQEFYYDISPIEVLEELKTTLITGEYPTKMVEE